MENTRAQFLVRCPQINLSIKQKLRTLHWDDTWSWVEGRECLAFGCKYKLVKVQEEARETKATKIQCGWKINLPLRRHHSRSKEEGCLTCQLNPVMFFFFFLSMFPFLVWYQALLEIKYWLFRLIKGPIECSFYCRFMKMGSVYWTSLIEQQ